MSRRAPTKLSDLDASGYHYPCYRPVPNVITGLYIPPRGPPPAAQKLGYLTSDRYSTVLSLYGNPTYYSSNVYNYYVDLDGVEVPLMGPESRPLYAKDTVYVPGRVGVWQIHLYGHPGGFYQY